MHTTSDGSLQLEQDGGLVAVTSFKQDCAVLSKEDCHDKLAEAPSATSETHGLELYGRKTNGRKTIWSQDWRLSHRFSRIALCFRKRTPTTSWPKHLLRPARLMVSSYIQWSQRRVL